MSVGKRSIATVKQVLAAKRLVQARLLRVRGGDVDVPAEERLRAGRVLEAVHEVHVADRVGRVGAEVRRGEVVLVDAARLGSVEVEEARARPAEVARHGRQERAGADRRCRRSAGAGGPARARAARGRGRRARRPPRSGRPARPSPPRPTRACTAASSGSSSSQPTVCSPTKPSSTSPSRATTCRRAKARAASLPGNGWRWRSAGCGRRGPHRVDDDHPRRRLGQPVLVGVRRRRRGVRAPDEDAGRVTRGRGSKPTSEVPYT